jgi:hypothetical protein
MQKEGFTNLGFSNEWISINLDCFKEPEIKLL